MRFEGWDAECAEDRGDTQRGREGMCRGVDRGLFGDAGFYDVLVF